MSVTTSHEIRKSFAFLRVFPYFDIRPEYQGWVTGRRIGHSRNIGPVALNHMRRAGKHPPARRYIPGKYGQSPISAAALLP
jgi:hypothetical protein